MNVNPNTPETSGSELTVNVVLDEKPTVHQLALAIKEIIEAHNALVAEIQAHSQPRNRGPKSERSMTDKDAWRCRFGDLVKSSHKEAAAALGLSYGQVYSCRNGYTFQSVKSDSFTIVEESK
jgi:hypothetical protein